MTRTGYGGPPGTSRRARTPEPRVTGQAIADLGKLLCGTPCTGGRLRLIFLPGYSPELNPDEWVWKNVKHDRIGKTGVTSKADLKSKAIGALRRLQKPPGLVRAFFADPHLRYITA